MTDDLHLTAVKLTLKLWDKNGALVMAFGVDLKKKRSHTCYD